ncbi:MAG TPA: hypothetical protein VN019_07425, partial [Oxalicibacterium sp.]|nr:hypothetical protein [Oxalicibacterium sp.]
MAHDAERAYMRIDRQQNQGNQGEEHHLCAGRGALLEKWWRTVFHLLTDYCLTRLRGKPETQSETKRRVEENF